MLNVVTGDPGSIVETLIGDDRVAVISFTGSAHVGWTLKERSPRKHHVLELGSNTAMVVTAEANLDSAVSAAVTSSFTFSGQACISLQRIYVHEQLSESFMDLLRIRTEELATGDPRNEKTVVGPMITKGAQKRVLDGSKRRWPRVR